MEPIVGLEDILAQRAGDYFPELKDGKVEVEVRDLHYKEQNKVLKIILSSREKNFTLIGKRHEGVKWEYERMEYLWDLHYHKEKEYRIPKPYDHLAEHSLLLMECVDGIIFKDKLYTHLLFPLSRMKWPFIRDGIRRSARWMVLFEKIIPKESCKLDKYLVPALESLEQRSFIDDPLKRAIRSFVEDEGSTIDTIPEFFLDNDFKPHNIFLTAEGLVVFDWSMAVPYYIFTMAYSYIRPFYTFRRFPFYSKTVLDRCVKTFLDLYWQETIFREQRHLFPLMGVIYELEYLQKSKFEGKVSWTNRKSRDIALEKIRAHMAREL